MVADDNTAIVVTNGQLDDIHGKTAHGLIRHGKRYRIVGVIDPVHAGKDAGEVVDGTRRGIPVYASIDACLSNGAAPPRYCIVGCALPGGMLTPELANVLEAALRRGISVVNGMHEFLSDDPAWVALAAENKAEIVDVRKPQGPRRFWTGRVLDLPIPRIAVLGTDCAVGKRTTARILCAACESQGIRSRMVTTGQTGWMQGDGEAFILDSIPHDFVCGGLEHAILRAADRNPHVIVIEGQAAFRNPSGPCGAEFLVAGGARGVVLQHAPGRRYFEGLDRPIPIPPIEEDLELVRLYGARTLAVTLNGEGLDEAELRAERARFEDRLGVPVALPFQDGLEGLVPVIRAFIEEEGTPCG